MVPFFILITLKSLFTLLYNFGVAEIKFGSILKNVMLNKCEYYFVTCDYRIKEQNFLPEYIPVQTRLLKQHNR